MTKQWYTMTASTGPIDSFNDELTEVVAREIAQRGVLQGAVVAGNSLTRTMSVRGSVESEGPADAILLGLQELGHAFLVVLERPEIFEFGIMRDLPEDEFASARDDIVGTPDVAARLGISRQRVAQLVEQKGRFPTPIATVRGTHVWRWGDIADWIAAGARDRRRRRQVSDNPTAAVDNTIDLMAALKKSIARERAAHEATTPPPRRKKAG